MFIHPDILWLQRLKITSLSCCIKVMQKYFHQWLAIILPLLVKASGKSKEITVIGSLVSLGHFLCLCIKTRQSDRASQPDFEDHSQQTGFQMREQTGFLASWRYIYQNRVSLLAVGDADCIGRIEDNVECPKAAHFNMVIFSRTGILEQVILTETIGKCIGKTLNIPALHHIAILEKRSVIYIHSNYSFNITGPVRTPDLFRIFQFQKITLSLQVPYQP